MTDLVVDCLYKFKLHVLKFVCTVFSNVVGSGCKYYALDLIWAFYLFVCLSDPLHTHYITYYKTQFLDHNINCE